jgi:enediyne biosynthesis protein E4
MTTTAPVQKPAQSAGPKQWVFVLIFIAILAGTVFCREFLSGPRTQARAQQSRDSALARYACFFEEVSKQCGIDFKHQSPVKLDSRLSHIMPIIASMGASVTVVDFDRDGWPDLYVVTSIEGGKNRLYRNKHDGTFEDVAEKMGIADLNSVEAGVCMGAVWGDYDNDGYEDLLVYRWGRPELYHNDKGKGFTRVTDKAGLPAWVNANSAVWLDFDGDGLLDLFIAGYWADDINLWNLATTKIMPESFQYANNGGRKYLLRNKGDGTFEDVTEKMGIHSKRWTLAVAAADLRGTGYPDIVLANDYGVNEYYANQGGKGFVEIGAKNKIGDQSKSGMSVSFGDIYNQGRFSIYVTNISEPGILLQGNNLWVLPPKAAKNELVYDNYAGSLGVEMGGWSWGAQFGDLNNDGLVDLFLTNGYISADRHHAYWYDYSLIAGSASKIISDAANWPPMKGRSLGGYQQKCVWLNRNGKFDDVCRAVGVNDTFDGRAVALVDLWNRGVLDVVLANQNGPLLVYQNTVAPDNDWIQFELKGTKSNTSAIGAQVRLHWNGGVQVQEVSGGNGYASQNQRRLHFGLGKNAQVERAVIRWPSGQTQTIDAPKIRMVHTIEEQS